MTGFKIQPTVDTGQRSPRRHKPSYLSDIRKLPCLVCKAHGRSEAAHVRYPSNEYYKRLTGMQEKPSDYWTVPLCRECHRSQHDMNEQLWWLGRKIDPLFICALLVLHQGDFAMQERIIMDAGRERSK